MAMEGSSFLRKSGLGSKLFLFLSASGGEFCWVCPSFSILNHMQRIAASSEGALGRNVAVPLERFRQFPLCRRRRRGGGGGGGERARLGRRSVRRRRSSSRALLCRAAWRWRRAVGRARRRAMARAPPRAPGVRVHGAVRGSHNRIGSGHLLRLGLGDGAEEWWRRCWVRNGSKELSNVWELGCGGESSVRDQAWSLTPSSAVDFHRRH